MDLGARVKAIIRPSCRKARSRARSLEDLMPTNGLRSCLPLVEGTFSCPLLARLWFPFDPCISLLLYHGLFSGRSLDEHLLGYDAGLRVLSSSLDLARHFSLFLYPDDLLCCTTTIDWEPHLMPQLIVAGEKSINDLQRLCPRIISEICEVDLDPVV